LINFFILFTICFASNPINNWININEDILSNDIKSASMNLEINSIFSNQINNSSANIKIFLASDDKFRINFKNRIVVSDGKSWKVYDVYSNQLFIQGPDKKLEKILFSLSKIKRIKAFPVKKINDEEYEISLFDKSQSARLFFNYNNDLEYILIINDNLKIKISHIELKKENSINLLVGDENTEIFDLR
tara:strand:- start:4 stop:570 length:567 start_codon:yes stop_codon:yes gene_type:complete